MASYPYPPYGGAPPATGSPGITNRQRSGGSAPVGLSTRPQGNMEYASQTLERQNDEHVDKLHEKAAMLKHLTLNLGDEIVESNKFLDSMNTTFGSTEGLLEGASRRLRDLRRSGNGRLWCYLTGFLCFFFFVIYFFLWKK
jgi:hypothetical protein